MKECETQDEEDIQKADRVQLLAEDNKSVARGHFLYSHEMDEMLEQINFCNYLQARQYVLMRDVPHWQPSEIIRCV